MNIDLDIAAEHLENWGITLIRKKEKTWTEICRNCGKCCANVPFSEDFINANITKAQKPFSELIPVLDAFIPKTEDGYCLFLTKDKRCAIYSDRPEVCRLQGEIPELPCPYKK